MKQNGRWYQHVLAVGALFDKGDIERTNSSILFVWCLCMCYVCFCLFYEFVGIGFMGRLEEGFMFEKSFWYTHLLALRLPRAVDRMSKSSYPLANWIVICIHLAC